MLIGGRRYPVAGSITMDQILIDCGDEPVAAEDEVVLISSAGVTIRLPVREISSQGRDATGVRVMNLEAGQTVASVAPILASDDDD